MTIDGSHYSLSVSKVVEEMENGVHVVASNDAGEDTCAIKIRVIEDSMRRECMAQL